MVSLSVYVCISLCVIFFSNTRAAPKSSPCHLSLFWYYIINIQNILYLKSKAQNTDFVQFYREGVKIILLPNRTSQTVYILIVSVITFNHGKVSSRFVCGQRCKTKVKRQTHVFHLLPWWKWGHLLVKWSFRRIKIKILVIFILLIISIDGALYFRYDYKTIKAHIWICFYLQIKSTNIRSIFLLIPSFGKYAPNL